MDYDQLDSTTRLNMVRARIRDIESQYFSLSLRVNTPDLTVPISEQDQANLAVLETSLTNLKQMEKDLVPPTPAPAPTPTSSG